MQQRKSEPSSAGLKALVNAYERQLIQSALAAASGNQRRAAAALGLLPTTLHEKMKRLGLLRRPRREDEDGEPEREREEELLAQA
jgi:two-component system response regulator HydG